MVLVWLVFRWVWIIWLLFNDEILFQEHADRCSFPILCFTKQNLVNRNLINLSGCWDIKFYEKSKRKYAAYLLMKLYSDATWECISECASDHPSLIMSPSIWGYGQIHVIKKSGEDKYSTRGTIYGNIYPLHKMQRYPTCYIVTNGTKVS